MANGGSVVGGLVLLALLLGLYFLPSFVAMGNKHHNAGGIFLVNLLLGWTLLGWVVALVWAVSKPAQVQPVTVTTSYVSPSAAPASDTRACPYCAETIKRAAKVCRFCNREVEPAA